MFFTHPLLSSSDTFTWVDAIVILPVAVMFSLPLYFVNALSGPNGLGYQKLIPQILIPETKRIDTHPTLFESILN